MLCPHAAVLAAICLLSLSGCQTPTIMSGSRCLDGSSMCEEPGIPFWTKVPRTVRTSQWLVVEAYSISVSARTFGEAKATEALLTWTPLTVPATKEARTAIDQLRKNIASDKSVTLEAARNTVWSELGRLHEIQSPSPDEKWACNKTDASVKNIKSLDTEPVLVSNVATKELVLEAKRYYWTQRVPLFGSAQGSVKLGEDGTLSEGTTNVQDDTAKTLLSVFPATALLSRAFGLASAAPAAGTIETTMRSADFGIGDKGKSQSFQIAVTVIPKASMYVVKRVCEFGTNDSRCLSLEPIRIWSAVCAHDAQLVSVLPVSESVESESPPAYEVSGRIVPPKAGK